MYHICIVYVFYYTYIIMYCTYFIIHICNKIYYITTEVVNVKDQNNVGLKIIDVI